MDLRRQLDEGTVENEREEASASNAEPDSDSDSESDSDESMSLAESAPSIELTNTVAPAPNSIVDASEPAISEVECVKSPRPVQSMALDEASETSETGESESDSSSSADSSSSLPYRNGVSDRVALPPAIAQDPVASQRLYIGNLPYTVTEAELRDVFGTQSIDLESVNIPNNPLTGRPAGYAFVNVASPAEFERAVVSLGGISIQNRKLLIQLARISGEGDSKPKPPVKPKTTVKAPSILPTTSTNVNHGSAQHDAASPPAEESDDYEPPDADVGPEPTQAMDMDTSSDSDSEYEPPDTFPAPGCAMRTDSIVVTAIPGESQHASQPAPAREVAIDGGEAVSQITSASERTSTLVW